MTEILITSSVLITAIIIIRLVFRKKLNQTFIYALWGLVLLRLLIPYTVSSPVSIMNTITASVSEQFITGDTTVITTESTDNSENFSDKRVAKTNKLPSQDTNISEYLFIIWISGIILTASWFLFSNIFFCLRLLKKRKPINIQGYKLPVYISDIISSPCLFGIFKPSVYITQTAAQDEQKKLHILTHELCHYNHWDQIWSAARILCISVYWFDPLVWIAAVLSKHDCEFACDESAIRLLGQEHKLAYGRTLVDLVSSKTTLSFLTVSATTMTAGKNNMKKRINMIIKSPKTIISSFIALVLTLCILAGCTFTGASKQLAPQQALEQLTQSIEYKNDTINFTLPQNYNDAEKWNIIISGRMAAENNMGMSIHLFEDINQDSLWKKGETYTIDLNNIIYTELIMEASLKNTDSDITIDLTQYIPNNNTETKQYNKYFLSFPAYHEGRTEYNKEIYETEPFIVSLALPDGWKIKNPEITSQIIGAFTPMEIWKGNEYIGFIGYNKYKEYEDLPEEDYYKGVYADIRLGSLYSWDDYTPVRTTDKTETALAVVSYKTVPEGRSAVEIPYTEVPGILSYDKDRLVYISIQFAENAVTDEQVRTIAESIEITGSEIIDVEPPFYGTSKTIDFNSQADGTSVTKE